MVNLKSLIVSSLLSHLAHSLTFKACTDDACSVGCVDFSDIATGDCLNFGFTAWSIYFSGTTDDLDVWGPERSTCIGGLGSEDAWLNPLSSGPCFAASDSDNDSSSGFGWAMLSPGGE